MGPYVTIESTISPMLLLLLPRGHAKEYCSAKPASLSTYYPKAFEKLKRVLCIIVVIIFIFSYLHLFGRHLQAYDKLLRALTAPECDDDILNNEEWLKLLKPLLVFITRGIVRAQSVLDLIILFHLFFIITSIFSFFFFLCVLEVPFPTM